MIASHSSAATPNQHPKSDRARLGRELAGHDPTRRLAVDALCKPRRTPAVARLGLHEDLSSSPEPSRRVCQQPPSCRVRRPGTSSLHRRSLGAARGLAAPKGLQGRPRRQLSLESPNWHHRSPPGTQVHRMCDSVGPDGSRWGASEAHRKPIKQPIRWGCSRDPTALRASVETHHARHLL